MALLTAETRPDEPEPAAPYELVRIASATPLEPSATMNLPSPVRVWLLRVLVVSHLLLASSFQKQSRWLVLSQTKPLSVW